MSYKHEIPIVVSALKLYLGSLEEKSGEEVKAETAFRTLYRLMSDVPGRPRYPEFSWEILEYYVVFHGKDDLGLV